MTLATALDVSQEHSVWVMVNGNLVQEVLHHWPVALKQETVHARITASL